MFEEVSYTLIITVLQNYLNILYFNFIKILNSSIKTPPVNTLESFMFLRLNFM